MLANKITVDYFRQEYGDFRKIMCSANYSTEQKLDAFEALVFVYMNIDPSISKEDESSCQIAMQSLKIEFDMRLGYQAVMEIHALYEQIV